ncbi:hypothetical protein GBAR_LOCUS13287 [Geodia barretti]|uniref:Histidine kinase/HSP90-like ATPase domain-containing protein n=1 Tax=Geodia barretti TaxID=519541 RepID=A0AA35WIF1_GEOBA|nr:hypothetical protein GBAR_LOCUS13287 [Geodia barretti]
MFIGQLAQQLGFCRTRIYDIELIIDEVCSNAIEHGSETPDSGIDLTLMFDSNKLEIHVRDKGKSVRKNWLATGRLDEVSQKMTLTVNVDTASFSRKSSQTPSKY